MKKQILLTILLAVLIVCCLALTACHTHEFVPSVVITKETCTQDGSYVGTCECGKTETVVVKALGHDEIQHTAQATSCNEIGWDAYVTCSRCSYSTYNEISATGHNYVNDVCSICGDCAYLRFDLTTSGEGYIVYVSGACTQTEIVIPSTYKGKPVTRIGTFQGCTTLTSITIPNSVTSIGYGAFWGCTSLTSITIPNSVTSIDECTFKDCTNLTDITIPSSITSIGAQAFEGCSNLTNVIIPSSVTSIGHHAFSGCASIASITIPEGVTSIGDRLFFNCSNLTNIALPSSVVNIGSQAFQGCTSLTSITISSSVTSIGNYAFYGCTNLTSVTFADPNGWYVTRIEGATSGTSLTLTDPSQNAAYLKNPSHYTGYYWYKSN